MANQSPRPSLPVRVPVNYPTTPTPGKIRILYDANKKDLYHKLSPYGYDTFLGIKTRQPFFYTYPDEAKNSSEYYIVDLFQHSIRDVQRVTKWMGSQQGIVFLTKQFLMQTGNAFNETRIWNPTSPIVAAGMPLTFWSARPLRHVDTSDLLGSFLGGLGKTIGGLFGTTTKPPRPPAGTIGGALAQNSITAQWGGKGLLRAGTANKAKTVMVSKWPAGTPKGTGILGFLGQTLKSMFGNFIPERQTGVTARTDEVMYGMMLSSTSGENGVFTYQGANGQIDGVQQFWFGGSMNVTRKGSGGRPTNWVKLYVDKNGKPIWEPPRESLRISGLTGPIGYSVQQTDKPVRYGDYVGTEAKSDNWEGSDVLIQHSKYAEEDKHYPSKLTDKSTDQFQLMRANLQAVLDKIRVGNVYSISDNGESSVLPPANRSVIGYDRIVAMKSHGATEDQYRYSVLKEYKDRNIAVLENANTNNPKDKSKKLASSGQFDGINTLTVLGKDRRIVDQKIAGWSEWKPYHDDQIAFYFYDVVNEKYIPFRAIIRGLQETDSATWEELSFVGRADRLYSYGGFNRSLTFSFTVHINSILELAPTWQRINYLMSLVKPARYTTNEQQTSAAANPKSIYNRFPVPPMVMITIGDLYKNQPVVLASAGLSIPDTALWETLTPENSDNQWSYLAEYIKAPSVGKLYGQLPKTAEISINAYILEQERAIVGAAHFGKAPHKEDYQKGEYRRVLPDDSEPTELHKSFVVYQEQK